MFSKIVVLGAGNGGLAMAADLSMAGYKVNLFDLPEFSKNLEPVIEKGGIDVLARTALEEEFQLPGGGKTGFAKITGKITSNIREAMDGVDLIMLVVPAYGRERFIKEFAPYLQDGQIMIIWPGNFGAIQCLKILKDMNINKKITICETESLIYACRKLGPSQIWIKNKKEKLLLAVLPSKRITEILKELNKIYPQLKPANNVLETTLANPNVLMHPQSILLNLYRVERKFYPYFEGVVGPLEGVGGPMYDNYDITPGMANVMEAVDRERRSLGERLGLKIESFKDTLQAFYGGKEKNLYETILNCKTYKTQFSPTSLNHRYILEDVPFGLVPFALLGDQIKVSTPTTRAMAEIGCAVTGKDFWNLGLTMEKLGINNMNTKEINEYIES